MRGLTPEAPYLPTAGINPDGNGYSLAAAECCLLENLRPFPKQVETREGTTVLYDLVTPPPMNHFHYLAHAQIASAVLFGFSDRCIWEHVQGTYPYWIPEGVDSSQANIFDPLAANVTYAKTGEQHNLGFFGAVPDTERGTYTNAVDGEFPLDAAITYTAGQMLLFYLPGVTEVTATLSNASVVTLGNDGDFWYLPITGAPTVSFLSCTENVFPRGIVWVLDFHCNCAFFSSAEVYDTDGVKLVVAGSNPPNQGEQETDGNQRVFWQYTGGAWAEKTSSQLFSVLSEGTGVNAPGHAATVSDATIPDQMTAGDVIRPGLVNFLTLEGGLIGTASAALSGGSYEVYSVDGYLDASGSSVDEDGTWDLEFTASGFAKFGGQEILIDYTFESEIPINPRHVFFFGGRLIMGGTYEDSVYYPWKVRSSFAGDSDYFYGLAYNDLVDYGLETIEVFAPLGNNLFAYTREGLYRGFLDNAGNLLFSSFWRGGAVCGRTVVPMNNIHFYMGQEDIYVFDGSTVTGITGNQSGTRVKETLFSALNSQFYKRCFGFYYPQEKELWFFFRELADYPTRAWVYSLERQSWTNFTFGEIRSWGTNVYANGSSWGDLAGTWGDMQLTWGELGKQSANRSIVLGGVDGPVMVDPGKASDNSGKHGVSTSYASEALALAAAGAGDVTIESNSFWYNVTPLVANSLLWKMITRDFSYGRLERKDRTLCMDFESRGSTVAIGINGEFSLDAMEFIQKYTVTLTSDFAKKSYHPDFSGYATRFSFEGEGYFALRWLQSYAKVLQFKGEV
jgi:hypothetical protein